MGDFFEVAGVRRSTDGPGHRTFVLFDDAKIFMVADEAGCFAFRIAVLRTGFQCRGECWILDGQRDFFRVDGSCGFFIVPQDIDGSFLLVVIDGELDMELASAPIRDCTAVRAFTMGMPSSSCPL